MADANATGDSVEEGVSTSTGEKSPTVEKRQSCGTAFKSFCRCFPKWTLIPALLVVAIVLMATILGVRYNKEQQDATETELKFGEWSRLRPGVDALTFYSPEGGEEVPSRRSRFGWSVDVRGPFAVVADPAPPQIRQGYVHLYASEAVKNPTLNSLLFGSEDESTVEFAVSPDASWKRLHTFSKPQDLGTQYVGFAADLVLGSTGLLVGAPNRSLYGSIFTYYNEGDENSPNVETAEVQYPPSEHFMDGASGWIRFGSCLASDGKTLAAATVSSSSDLISAFIFDYNEVLRSWIFSSMLPPFEGPAGQDFRLACPLSVHGDYVVMGAPDLSGRGSAVVFKRTAGKWEQNAVLPDSDSGGGGKYFGSAVAIYRERIVIGNADATSKPGGKSAFVYELKDETKWTQTARLRPDEQWNETFSCSLAAGDGLIVVGSCPDNSRGSIYVYGHDKEGRWKEMKRLDLPGNESETRAKGTPLSLAIDRDRRGVTLLVGIPQVALTAGNQTVADGEAYICSASLQ